MSYPCFFTRLHELPRASEWQPLKRVEIRRLRGKVLQERTRFLFTGAGFWDPQIGVVADSITWPFPTRCCRTRPFDHERDDD